MENEYYTFEQLVSAGIACYSTTILKEDVERFTIGLKEYSPKLIRLDSGIHYTNKFIKYDSMYYQWYQSLNLDDYMFYGKQRITIQDYLMLIAGDKLINFMQTDDLNYGKSRTLKRK